MLYGFHNKFASIFQLDVVDDVMVNAKPVKQLDHVVGILA